MYKLTLGSINEIKYSKTDAHGLFSGTIETDRVVLVDGDGKYLQVDGNWGTELKNGLVRTWSATRDSAEIEYQIATTNATTTAAVYVYDGIMALQSTYADVDAFIDYLVSEAVITIEGYVAPEPDNTGKGPTRLALKADDKSDSESEKEPEVAETKEDEVETKSEVEQEVEQEVESEPDLEPESKPEEK
jgi:hypothetical protein